MSIIRSKKLYYINSRNRANGTNESFAYKIELPTPNHFDHVCVMQAVIPKSYYLVQEGQNTFYSQVIVNDTSFNENTITIPPGNYTRRTFQTVVQNKLNSFSLSYWTVTFQEKQNEPSTGKFKYVFDYGDPNLNIKVVLRFENYLYEQMGFEPNSINNSTESQSSTDGKSTLTSTNVIKLQKEDVLYIHSDIANNDGDDILQEIYSSTGNADFANIYYRCIDVDAYSKSLRFKDSNTYKFWITNEDGQIMDLNGLNMNMTIMLYERDNVNNVIRTQAKLKSLKK